MAQGIQIPLKTNNGRLQKLSGDDYIDLLIRVALIGAESENPFQTLGLGEWMIFGINDAMAEAEIREKVVLIFEAFKADQLAKINDPSTDITFDHNEGDMLMNVSYINMETQERVELDVPIPDGGI
jgi:hypothetical protein